MRGVRGVAGSRAAQGPVAPGTLPLQPLKRVAERLAAARPSPSVPPHTAAKLGVLASLLGLSGAPEGRARVLAAATAAPVVLAAPESELRASYDALLGLVDADAARALLLASPRGMALLALGGRQLAARVAALRALADLSPDWASRVAAARAAPQQLAAVLGAAGAASARLAWLADSKQRLAPGGIGLVELLDLGDAAFSDIYPHWQPPAAAA
jgi:hypothetical protein